MSSTTAVPAATESTMDRLMALIPQIEQATEALTTAKSADERKKVQAQLEQLVADKDELKAQLLREEYAKLEAEYRSESNRSKPGVKAALRKRMNDVREAQGLPPLVAGTSGVTVNTTAALLDALANL